MTRKTSLSGKAQLFTASLFAALFCSCAQQPSSPKLSTRLEQLLSGISFDEQMRLKVKDISIDKDGKASVKDLFRVLDEPNPSVVERYVWVEKNTKNIAIKDAASLEELRQKLAARHADQLIVTLEGDQDTVWRALPGELYEAWNTKEVGITILPTPCDEINRIIYDRINSTIREQVEKQTDKSIDLDQVFDLLLRGELKPYLAGLGEAKKSDPCFKTFHLVEWLEGKETPGFRSGKYEMTGSLRGLLDPAINALADTRSTWARYNLSVKVTGYTDDDPVKQKEIDLRTEQTGIKDWSKIEKPLDVRYLGCTDNNLNLKNSVFFVGFRSGEGRQVGQKISNNCELGAVRAYVAVVYIKNRLGWQDVEYSYATGGVARPDSNNGKKDDSKRRKINIEFIIKAATTDK